ncbi:MAG: hypothetical protein O7D30_12590, partial [Rickettsia endosymbiont of Ixodes persulcatus]|nr:hypothetical protein [Rickettsia endosymbiont of Ixodes persulcatus]
AFGNPRSSVHSVLFTKIRSLILKRDDVGSLVETCDADSFVLTETWLNPDISDAELFPSYPNFRL